MRNYCVSRSCVRSISRSGSDINFHLSLLTLHIRQAEQPDVVNWTTLHVTQVCQHPYTDATISVVVVYKSLQTPHMRQDEQSDQACRHTYTNITISLVVVYTSHHNPAYETS